MTALELANRALRVLGEPKLTGFDDSGSKATTINDLFPSTFRKHLTDDDWFWARARALLVVVTGLTHYTEYEYAYLLPYRMLIPIEVYDSNDARVPYRIEGEYLYCDDDAPRILYTINCLTTDSSGYPELVTGYGDLIPDYWAESFAYTLAADIAFPITRDGDLAQRIRSEGLFLANKRARELNAKSSPGYGEITEDWGGHLVAERRHPLREY